MILLASASPRRSELLERWGVPFRIQPARDIEEKLAGTAVEAAVSLARKKADSVLRELIGRGAAPPDLVVLGADTVVEAGGSLLGKPGDLAEAREMLELLSGRPHRVVTGVALAFPGRPTRADREISEVTFRPLAKSDLDRYLAGDDWEGKAGAYGIQSGAATLIEGFRGCYYNIVGLPVVLVLSMLRREGWRRAPCLSCDCFQHPLWRGSLGCK